MRRFILLRAPLGARPVEAIALRAVRRECPSWRIRAPASVSGCCPDVIAQMAQARVSSVTTATMLHEIAPTLTASPELDSRVGSSDYGTTASPTASGENDPGIIAEVIAQGSISGAAVSLFDVFPLRHHLHDADGHGPHRHGADLPGNSSLFPGKRRRAAVQATSVSSVSS